MQGSNLTYEQVLTISQTLNKYASDMQIILDEIIQLTAKIGNEDIWGGTAALNAKSKFANLSGKFGEFYEAIQLESKFLATVVENYKKTDIKISD